MADEKERIVGYRPCPFCKERRKEPSDQTCEVCKAEWQVPIYEKKNWRTWTSGLPETPLHFFLELRACSERMGY